MALFKERKWESMESKSPIISWFQLCTVNTQIRHHNRAFLDGWSSLYPIWASFEMVLVLRGVYVLWSLNTACFVWEWEKSSKFKVHILKKIFSWDVKFVFGLSPAISSITVLQSTFPISHPASPFWSKPPKHASWLLDSVIWWALTKCDTNMFCPTQRNVGHSEWFL